ncbi:hypothetical protein BJ165DRAFT_1559081 [Panaeolus papilionaceus]|nr:hypothetical protein BJ165DRAFT_1559081 [Panaeolus papilionaceus]
MHINSYMNLERREEKREMMREGKGGENGWGDGGGREERSGFSVAENVEKNIKFFDGIYEVLAQFYVGVVFGLLKVLDWQIHSDVVAVSELIQQRQLQQMQKVAAAASGAGGKMAPPPAALLGKRVAVPALKLQAERLMPLLSLSSLLLLSLPSSPTDGTSNANGNGRGAGGGQVQYRPPNPITTPLIAHGSTMLTVHSPLTPGCSLEKIGGVQGMSGSASASASGGSTPSQGLGSATTNNRNTTTTNVTTEPPSAPGSPSSSTASLAGSPTSTSPHTSHSLSAYALTLLHTHMPLTSPPHSPNLGLWRGVGVGWAGWVLEALLNVTSFITSSSEPDFTLAGGQYPRGKLLTHVFGEGAHVLSLRSFCIGDSFLAASLGTLDIQAIKAGIKYNFIIVTNCVLEKWREIYSEFDIESLQAVHQPHSTHPTCTCRGRNFTPLHAGLPPLIGGFLVAGFPLGASGTKEGGGSVGAGSGNGNGNTGSLVRRKDLKEKEREVKEEEVTGKLLMPMSVLGISVKGLMALDVPSAINTSATNSPAPTSTTNTPVGSPVTALSTISDVEQPSTPQSTSQVLTSTATTTTGVAPPASSTLFAIPPPLLNSTSPVTAATPLLDVTTTTSSSTPPAPAPVSLPMTLASESEIGFGFQPQEGFLFASTNSSTPDVSNNTATPTMPSMESVDMNVEPDQAPVQPLAQDEMGGVTNTSQAPQQAQQQQQHVDLGTFGMFDALGGANGIGSGLVGMVGVGGVDSPFGVYHHQAPDVQQDGEQQGQGQGQTMQQTQDPLQPQTSLSPLPSSVGSVTLAGGTIFGHHHHPLHHHHSHESLGSHDVGGNTQAGQSGQGGEGGMLLDPMGLQMAGMGDMQMGGGGGGSGAGNGGGTMLDLPDYDYSLLNLTQQHNPPPPPTVLSDARDFLVHAPTSPTPFNMVKAYSPSLIVNLATVSRVVQVVIVSIGDHIQMEGQNGYWEVGDVVWGAPAHCRWPGQDGTLQALERQSERPHPMVIIAMKPQELEVLICSHALPIPLHRRLQRANNYTHLANSCFKDKKTTRGSKELEKPTKITLYPMVIEPKYVTPNDPAKSPYLPSHLHPCGIRMLRQDMDRTSLS